METSSHFVRTPEVRSNAAEVYGESIVDVAAPSTNCHETPIADIGFGKILPSWAFIACGFAEIRFPSAGIGTDKFDYCT